MQTDWTNFAQGLSGRAVAVVGLGLSGLASAQALRAGGIKTLVWDDSPAQREQAAVAGFEICDFTALTDWTRIAFVLLSPGIPLHFPQPHAAVTMARAAGVEVIGDIEVWCRLNKHAKTGARIIAITGTNGKSTTTALIHHVLKEAGISCAMAGNIGKPILQAEPDAQWMVLEMSSYQLDLTPSFAPDVAILLNITPDHLDRHGSLAHYIAAKEAIFRKALRCVIGVDDEICRAMAERLAQAGKDVKRISYRDAALDAFKDVGVLRGDHNRQNIVAAFAAVQATGLDVAAFKKGLATFPGLAHRQFRVRQIGPVVFINDSKATNADATRHALAAYEDIYWIAGGRPKEGGLQGLESFASKIRHAYLIGEATEDFARWMQAQQISFTRSHTLESAVQNAYNDVRNAGTAATVLLSPACASFDQFKNFEARGDAFAALVNGLKS
ncbi:MAG: UDP-N-acetylmuramoyl-L-alanine--D-glutamate ligase [Alphaproteobacteria bacterium]|nr:UDP-N-acetylmuramoyl-L-alanine--D-glutamate ligase [Alphaproteobacteria bacterium]